MKSFCTHANPASMPGARRRAATAWRVCVALWVTSAAALCHDVVRPGNCRCYYLSPVDGSLQPYHVYVPETYRPDRPAPVVFSLHGFGGRTGAPGHGWRARWADRHGWLLVRPDGRGSQNWDSLGEDDLFHVLADLQQTTPYHPALNVDTERLYVEGGSMGGHGAFRVATRYPGVFAAVAPVAGWTKFQEFYRHWYDAASQPHFPAYVDPARLPLLETASSIKQADNARSSWMYVTFDMNDAINPPHNALDMVKSVRRTGSVRVATKRGEAGHCGSNSAEHNYAFFLDKVRDAYPRTVVLTTNTIRHNRAHWLAVDRLRLQNKWARVEAQVKGQEIGIRTRGVLEFSLYPDARLLSMDETVTVWIDGRKCTVEAPASRLQFAARLNEALEIDGWDLVEDPAAELGVTRPVRKSHTLPGPLDDAFRSRFIVIYGAQPRSRRGRTGVDLRDAQQFAAEWNTWMTLHWGKQRPPGHRRGNWWRPPYPFRPGPHVHREQQLVVPYPDTDFTLDSLPRDRHLVLFGDPGSNWVIRQLADRLPLRVSEAGAGVRVQCGSRVYAGDHVNYLFLAPNPVAPAHYVVLARGYLSSRVDPDRYTARHVGKDLEALPFYWPDYVVWDARRAAGPTVQEPLRYLPDTFIESGFFGEDWRLQTRPPVPKLMIHGERLRSGAYRSPVTLKLAASDVSGGFGVSGIEYRVNDGPWTVFDKQITLAANSTLSVAARATNHCGQYVYRQQGAGMRAVPAPGNMSPEHTVRLEVRERWSVLRRTGRWLIKPFSGRD